ncbi:hypothetical protein CDL12_18841 [Handroanthus impetiginosus]|uniref:Uncharacterized protein n=1 Tax=Handroanthus impetiginosus TaxID=429701 RepID=A0A2G9GTG0_9LAMI|nr:hypothetical protein CDL12_18841 [Handroanthus impetiginosus]
MVSDEQFTGDRRSLRGRKGRRRWSGSMLAATPSREWKLRGGDLLRGPSGGEEAAVSARKLAASLWRLASTADCSGSLRWQCTVFDRFRFQLCSSMPIHELATEGVTKWDYCNSKTSDDVSCFLSHWKNKKSQEIAIASVVSSRWTEQSKTQKRISEPEDDCPKHKYCMKKFNEEREPSMRTEKEKLRLIFKNLKNDVKRERKICQKIDIANSKLLHNIAEVKLSARKFMKNIEKEKKTRELLEDACDKLANEIKGNKAEMETLRNQQKRIQEEVEEARKMLQIAQVWREERAQMKLVDAKLILQKKYAEIDNLIADLEAFLKNSNATVDVNLLGKAEVLRQVFEPLKMQGVKEFPCILPKSVNESMIFKDSHTNEAEGRIHHRDPKANDATTKSVFSNGLTGGGSTQVEKTPGENENSVNKIRQNKNDKCESQKSESSGISSVKSGSSKPQRTIPRNKDTCKKVPFDGSRMLSNRSLSSTVSMASSQRVSGEGALEGHSTECQWPSSEHRNPHVVRAMKGHIEWPRGIRRNGLAANLLEAKLESQKMLLRNVLKQRS